MKRPIIAFIFCALFSLSSQATLPAVVDNQPLPSLAPMLEKIEGAVVNISTETEVQVRRRRNPFFDDPLYRRFFDLPRQGREKRKRQGLGSGVIFDASEGLILTNAHVIDGADRITVTLRDGREAEAEVIGIDKNSDVAVIEIGLDDLKSIPLGNSDILRVGDFVVAIGNPFGLHQTVTSGIVSALGRSDIGIEDYEDFIQTDASINPGNSGGALVNLRGELVGINTAIVAPSGGNVGIGFSIPINMALQIKDQLVDHGEVQRGRLGVRIQDLTPELANAFGIERSKGAIITKVEQDSMADNAGILPGDVVIMANSKKVDRGSDLRNTIGLLRIGDPLRLEVMRAGSPRVIQTTIGNVAVDRTIGANLNPHLAGAILNEVRDMQTERGVDQGVLVTAVEEGSMAWKNQLRVKDIIVSANRKTVRDLDGLRMAVANQNVFMLNILRGERAFYIVFRPS